MNLKKYLENIQNSDEATKKRWLIGLSAVTMAVIIGFWIIYLNNSVKKTSQPEKSETEFWQIFKVGLKVVGVSIKNKADNLFYKIMGERTITIENK